MRLRKSTTGNLGFTLLELLVTLTVMSLLLAVVAPLMAGSIAHAQLQTSATKVAMTLRQARSTARKSMNAVGVTFHGGGRFYSVGAKSYPLPSGEVLRFASTPGLGGDTGNMLTFLPDGSSSGGRLTVVHGNDAVQISVDWLTGRVAVID